MGVLEVKNKVQGILTDWLNDVRIDRDGDFVVPVGSSASFVSVREMGGETKRTVVIVQSIVVMGATPSPDLYKWIATDGQLYFFGGFRAAPRSDGLVDINFSYSILADYLDAEELKSAVGVVAFTADEMDEELVAKFGGQRFYEDR